MSAQDNIERLQDLMQQGLMTADQANIEMVKMDRVRLVINKLPMQVRRSLNEAVKNGELGHMKKDGHKPECYYHPTFDYLARSERKTHEQSILSIKSSGILK